MTNEEICATARQWLHAKTRYETMTPIRGKPHIKPLGNRRKQYETVELFDAEKQIYSYKLYDTHVIKFYPDGSIGINIDGKHHHTMTTATFISDNVHMLNASRANNRLWVSCAKGYFPMPDTGEIVFKPKENTVGNIEFEPAHKVMANKKVVNRKRAKEARAPYQEFIEFGKTLLKLSDGWIMPETKAPFMPKEVLGNGRIYFYPSHHEVHRLWSNLLDDKESYLKTFLYMTTRIQPKEWNWVPFESGTAEAYRFTPKQFADYVTKVVDRENDIYDIIEVEASGVFTRTYD